MEEKVKQTKEKVNQMIETLSVALLDEKRRARIIGDTVFAVLSVVSFFMTIVNIITLQPEEVGLTVCTGIFGVCNVINLLLCTIGHKGVKIASYLITIEFYVMFLYFLIWGVPQGFSAIWIGLLPPVSMLFYGRKKGTVISGSMMFVLVAILWTPLRDIVLQHDYFSDAFIMRFPLLYFAFYVMAFLLETLRAFASNEAKKMSDIYKDLSIKDQLTQVYNRNGLHECVSKQITEGVDKIGFAILDIDDFKKVNDTYGHMVGDQVLVDFATIIQESINATVCRWGGEEFAVVYYNDAVNEQDLNNLRLIIGGHEFKYEGGVNFRLTASIGAYETKTVSVEQLNSCMLMADNALYEAKNTGKNKVIYYKNKKS